MADKHDVSCSWSVDGNSIYLDDETIDERMVAIHFYDCKHFSKRQKLDTLSEIIQQLRSQLPAGEPKGTTIGS